MSFATFPHFQLCIGLMLAFLHGAAMAETVPVPDGFGIKPLQKLERLLYAERKGELPNGVHRATLEQVCRASKDVGATASLPVFELGHDQPVRTRSKQYFSADGTRRAVYTELTAYHCPEVKANGPCNCTYREIVKHSVEISVWQGGRLQRWQANLEDGTGTLEESTGPSPAALPAPDDAVLTRLFGPVVGRATVAGLTCAQRELPGATAPRRSCLTLPDPKLPPLLWGRAVSTSAGGGPEAGGMRQSSELLRLVLAADVDAAVFTPPAGIPYRSLRRAAPKEFQL